MELQHGLDEFCITKKVGGKEVQYLYKEESHPEEQAFRKSHEIFMEKHPLPDLKWICQATADESHIFWFDQSGKILCVPGGDASIRRGAGGRPGLTITPCATVTTKGRLQIIVCSKYIGEERFQAMQAKFHNVLKLVRNKSGYQTSATYNDFVKHVVVQMIKILRQKHPGMTPETPFEFQHDRFPGHVKGEFRNNIVEKFDDNWIIENQVPAHALKAFEPIIAAFKHMYEVNMSKRLGLSLDLRKRTAETASKVTFEMVIEELAKTWERLPNEWIAAAFVHCRLLTWEDAAAALQIDTSELQKHSDDLKTTVQKALKETIVTADPRMVGVVWPPRKRVRK